MFSKKQLSFFQKRRYFLAKESTPVFYVYIVKCLDNSYYTGYTENLLQRVISHKEGNGSKYTLKKGFSKLVYFEGHSSKEIALKREKQIKDAGRIYKEILVTQFQQNLCAFSL